MKYVLVDRGDNIIDKVELGSNVGVSGAKTFFIGRKKIDEKEFDNFDDWMKVVKTNRRYKKMSEKEVKEAWFFQVLKRRKREWRKLYKTNKDFS